MSSRGDMNNNNNNKPVNIQIQLGDIVEINAPTNSEINDHMFLVDYIDVVDNRKIRLIDVDTQAELTLKIDANGALSDESIHNLSILSRADHAGYARQNGLVTGTWVDIYFGGDLPTTITGLITNVEEDMIEIKTLPENDIIYIDFAYKGIPEDVPIERINIRMPPASSFDVTQDSTEEGDVTNIIREGRRGRLGIFEEGENATSQPEGTSDQTYGVEQVPATSSRVEEIREKMREIIIDADQIHFGEELDVLVQTVEVSDENKRYSIEKQTNDLLDELLSNVPNTKRTAAVLSRLHTMVERFKELRHEFSVFDENGNPQMMKEKGSAYKPLVTRIERMAVALQWILPVVKTRRIMYNIDDVLSGGATASEETREDDIIIEHLGDDIKSENEISRNFFANNETFSQYMTKTMDRHHTPFIQSIRNDNIIDYRKVNSNITSIIDNLGNFYSTAVTGVDHLHRQRFVIQRYNLGLNKLENASEVFSRSRHPYKFSQLTSNDSIGVSSYLVLPEQAVRYSRIHLPGTNILDRTNLNAHNLNYWEMLRKSTSIVTEEIEDLGKPLEFNAATFMNKITHYVLADNAIDSSSPSNSNVDKHRRFLEVIIPKTRVLFEIMRKYMNGKLSMNEVLGYLEPFSVYQNDLTAKQYEEITQFIHERILEYKRNYVNKSRSFTKFRAHKYMMRYAGVSLLYKLLVTGKMLDEKVFSTYGFADEQVRSGITNLAMATNQKERSRAKGQSYATGIGEQDTYNDHLLSSSELLSRMLLIDYAALYMDAIALTTVDIITPFDFNLILKEQSEQLHSKGEEAASNGERKELPKPKYVLAKKYNARVEMEYDNDYEFVFFHKEYDDTDYDYVDQYSVERNEMSEDDFRMFLTDRIIKDKNVGLSTAQELAETMMSNNRMRLVKDGHYAVLETKDVVYGDTNEEKHVIPTYQYYVRKNNVWVRDESIPESSPTDDMSYFCNINKNCLPLAVSEVVDKGVTTETTPEEGVKAMKKKLLDKMIEEFDIKYQVTREHFNTFINSRFDNDVKKTMRLLDISEKNMLKYNDRVYYIGVSGSSGSEDDGIVISPRASLRDMILGQNDYVKKQFDIIRFIKSYTRAANPTLKEDPWWLYCIQTNEKLLPTFLETIAATFIQSFTGMDSGVNLSVVIDTICKNQGTRSSDGEAWVDKYSGYIIKKIEHTTDEGYDDDGRKVVTREVLDIDAEKAVLEVTSHIPPGKSGAGLTTVTKYTSPDARMINGIITSISGNIGADLNEHREFIIQNTMKTLEMTVPSEETYKEQTERYFQKTGKKRPPFKEVYFQTLLLLSLAYIVIAVQVSIPEIKTRKTFPGCVRSFSGYPLDGVEDTTGIMYIACIAYKIQSGIEPWNTIRSIKKETDIMSKIRIFIDTFIVTNPAIQEMLQKKRDYMKSGRDTAIIPESLSVGKWANFLPPLNRQKNMKTPQNVSSDFTSSLLDEMKKGNKGQHEKMSILETKAMYFSFEIQQAIHEIVKKQSPLLSNSANEPLIENACCNEADTRSMKTIDYFKAADQSIHHNNNIIKYLNDIIYDMLAIGKAAFMSDYRNTKLAFPQISQHLDEEVIYMAFIHYCRLNSGLPISDELNMLCMDKPDDWNVNDSLNEKIRKMKRDSRIFTEESLHNLMRIINKENLIDSKYVRSDRREQLHFQRLRDVITYMNNMYDTREKEDESRGSGISADEKVNRCIIPEELRDLLLRNMDTFDISVEEDTEEMRDLKNYLARMNDAMEARIIAFVQENGKQSKTVMRDFIATIKNLLIFEENGSQILMSKRDETTTKSLQFIKNTLYCLIDVVPQIIMNRVDFDHLSMPQHWGFSETHLADVKNIISSHYTTLKQFYNDEVIKDVLRHAMKVFDNIKKMIEVTPFYAEMYFDDASGKIIPQYSIFDRRIVEQLFLFYFLSMMNEYVQLVVETPLTIYQNEATELIRPGSAASKRSKVQKGKNASQLDVIYREHEKIRDKTFDIVTSTQEETQVSDLNSVFNSYELQNGTINDMDIIMGNKKALGQRVSDLLVTFVKIVDSDKRAINMNLQTVKEKIIRVKDKEKDGFVKYLGDMSVEEREIENLFKKHSLGIWSKGNDSSVFAYDADAYDEEREKITRTAMNEKRLGKRDDVTAMNRDILMFEMLEKDIANDQIEREDNDMSWLPEDDDYPEYADSSYMFRHEGDGERDDPVTDAYWTMNE